MSKGARTLAELDRAVSILKTRDSTRARELKALRGDLDAIERQLTAEREAMLRALADNPLPADSAPVSSSHSWRNAGAAACNRLRFFIRRLFSH